MPEIFDCRHTLNTSVYVETAIAWPKNEQKEKKCKLNIRNHQLNRTFTAISVS